MRSVAILLSLVGLLLCFGAAGTGVYWGVILKGADPEWRKIHLDIAIACVFVSMGAHAVSIHMLRKSKA